MSGGEFKDKFVAYLDLVGFSSLVALAQAGAGPTVLDLIHLMEGLGRPEDREIYAEHGPILCPHSSPAARDLDFQVAQISDCALISAEASPAGVINLIDHCRRAAIRCFRQGVVVRGFVTRSIVHHRDMRFIASGLPRGADAETGALAFRSEADRRGTPFIEVDAQVVDYVRTCGDECAAAAFARFVRGDETSAAVFPFTVLRASAETASDPDAARERESATDVRSWLVDLRPMIASLVDASNPAAVRKAARYLAAVDEELALCERIERESHEGD